jgi:predicted enzyme related to lactoylglutathione lyase
MRFTGIMLGSETPKVLGDFYTKVLGKPGWQQDDWYGFDAGGGNLMVGPHSEVKGVNQAPGRIMFTFETNDIQADFNHIKSQGAKVVAEPYQPSKDDNPDTWLATFADPDENYFQLTTPWKQ